MPSREIKRVKKKKEDSHQKPEHKEKRNTNPILYIITLIILVVVVVTFLGTPVAGRVGQSQKIIFGTYDGKEIEYRPGNYLSRQKDILGEQLRQNSQSEDVLSQAYQVWREAFRRTVVHVGILKKTEESNLHVTDERIDFELTQYGPYVQNGEFSEELYQAASNAEKYSTRRLFRENLKEEQYRRDYFERLTSSSSSKAFVKSMATPERMFTFVNYAFGEYPLEEVIAYGEDNEYLFREINLSRITINSNLADAEAIREQITSGEAGFEELARTQSVDSYKEKGGEMGWVRYHSLQDDFPDEQTLQSVFDLAVGDVSGVIENNDLWFIYRCNEEAVDPDFDDEAVQEEVRTYMERFEAGRIEDYFIARADEFIATAGEVGFDQACLQHDKANNFTDYFPINYGSAFFLKSVRAMGETAALNSAPYNEDFFVQAFSLEENELSDPIILDRNVLVLKLQDEREPPANQVEQIEMYYQYIVQQYRDQDLRSYFLESDKLEDTFNQTFSKYFIPEQQQQG
jgi:hypothetical protein